jgi:Protein of unknown function (DUF732)
MRIDAPGNGNTVRMSLVSTVIGLGAALGLMSAPAANADDADFVRAVQEMGFLQRPDNLISQAESACYFLVRRRHPDEVEARIVRYTRIDPPSQAHSFLVLAVRTYCPQFTGLVGP